MNGRELNELFDKTVRSARPDVDQFEQLANALLEAHRSGDFRLQQHIRNRLKQIGDRTGENLVDRELDIGVARLVIADEIGFAGWDELIERLTNDEGEKPILFQYAVAAMVRGDFSALEEALGGSECFTDQIVDWYEAGYFDDESETLAEVFSAACMLGHAPAAGYLLDRGVDALAGTRTGLNGFHYAASSGRLAVIKLLIECEVPMEVRNMYGGTVLEQALWSAVHEHKPSHGEIVEALVDAGAYLEPGTLEWWDEQNVPSADTKRRVADVLQRHA